MRFLPHIMPFSLINGVLLLYLAALVQTQEIKENEFLPIKGYLDRDKIKQVKESIEHTLLNGDSGQICPIDDSSDKYENPWEQKLSKKCFPYFDEAASTFGFDWEAFDVYTEDGWRLRLFHVLSDTEGTPTPFESMKDKPPVLFMHGIGNSATSMMKQALSFGPTLPGLLANRGYDMWLGNFRGALYSNLH